MAISFVQVASATGNTVTVTLGSPTTAGNCLVACVALGNAGSLASVSSITLGGVNDNFAQLKAVGDLTVGAEQLAVWADPNCAGGQTSVVMTPVTASTNVMYVFEFSGIAASSILDQSATFDSGAGTNSTFSVTSGTTTQASELAVGCVYGFNTTITGPSSPWVNESTVTNATRTLQASYNILSSTGTVTYSGSFGAAANNGQILVTLKGAASAALQDIPSVQPGPTWFGLFKPWVQRPRPPAAEQPGNQPPPPQPDQMVIQPGPTWSGLFKPWWPRPRPPAPQPGWPDVTCSGSFALAPLAFSAQGGQTSPDQPSAQPGPAWLDLFKPWAWRPRPPAPQPGWPDVTSSGSFSLAPLALSGQGSQTSPDQPSVQPGSTWLGLFKRGLLKPRPFTPDAGQPGVTSSGSFALAPLALSGAGAQSSPDVTKAQPGPLWQRLFRPWVQRPVPPPPAFQSVNATGSLSLAPLAFSATAGQTSPDQPQAQPGPFWTRLFRPQAPKPLPPPPAVQAVSASGSFALAPLAFSSQGTQTSPDLPQAQPGPTWLRLLRPWQRRPYPPVPAVQAVTSSGSFTLAPLAFSGPGTPPLQDQLQAAPGPLWLRLFKPWIQRPIPPAPPAWLPPPATSSGSLSLAPLTFSAQGGQSSPDIPAAQPGPAWLRFFRPWVQRPVPPVPAVQSVTSSGSLALAPLALSGQGGQSAPDQPQASPGPSWLRFFRPWQWRPYPPVPATPAVNATGSFSLAPVALSSAGTVTGSGVADQPQVQPGPWWLRLFKPWAPRPVPQQPGAAVTAAARPPVRLAPGTARLPWTAGSARQTWTAGEARQPWTTGGARNQ